MCECGIAFKMCICANIFVLYIGVNVSALVWFRYACARFSSFVFTLETLPLLLPPTPNLPPLPSLPPIVKTILLKTKTTKPFFFNSVNVS